MSSDELNCSDGAKMLIERMQSNPEEFKNTYDARWRDILDCARAVVNDDEHSELISKRDAKAIMAAYDTHILEPRLAERIINELMEPEKSKKPKKQPMTQQEVDLYAQQMFEAEYYRRQSQLEQARRSNAAQQSASYGSSLGSLGGLGSLGNQGRW